MVLIDSLCSFQIIIIFGLVLAILLIWCFFRQIVIDPIKIAVKTITWGWIGDLLVVSVGYSIEYMYRKVRRE
jgi:hypothetical protein